MSSSMSHANDVLGHCSEYLLACTKAYWAASAAAFDVTSTMDAPVESTDASVTKGCAGAPLAPALTMALGAGPYQADAACNRLPRGCWADPPMAGRGEGAPSACDVSAKKRPLAGATAYRIY